MIAVHGYVRIQRCLYIHKVSNARILTAACILVPMMIVLILLAHSELPPTQSEDGASVNARKEGDVSSAIINAASAFAVAAGLVVVSLLLSCVA